MPTPDRRQRRTPYTLRPVDHSHWAVLAKDGSLIGVIVGGESVAQFIVRACNRYDRLLKAFDLCRGHFNSQTIQPGSLTAKGFQEVADDLLPEILKDGR